MNRSPSNKWKRETQTVFCFCGTLNRRWRFAERRGRFKQNSYNWRCKKCGRLLPFQGDYKPVTPRESNLACYRRRAIRNRLAGLTAHGAPRRRAAVSQEQKKARHALWRKARRAALHAQGLTTRGTRPKYRVKAQTLRGRYEEFRASLNLHLPRVEFTLARSLNE